MASACAARQKAKLKYNCKQVRLNWDGYLFLLPFALVFCLFTRAPVVTSLWYSFTYYNILEPATFIGFQNYINLFLNDEIFLIALKKMCIRDSCRAEWRWASVWMHGTSSIPKLLAYSSSSRSSVSVYRPRI